jgi:2-keto-4-pentenoate hydratase
VTGRDVTTISADLITAAADRLLDAHDRRVACEPVVGLLPGASIDDAYAVQEANTERWLAGGRRLVGRKIGLTSTAVQSQLGVDRPDYGMLFADMAADEGGDIDIGRLLQPRAEAEIAFVIGRDLPDPETTVAEVLRAIEFAVAAIEIVDSRIADWRIGIIDTVADNASSGMFVLGSTPVALGSFDPVMCGMVMERRGEPVSVGAGRACLGSPISATAWLARTMAAGGRPLRAGDTVLSGALGPMVPVRPGDVFEARISGLGSVTAAFSEVAS